jgi:hypothetical protein
MHAIVDLAARSGATKLKTEGSFCDPNLLAGSKKKSRVTKKTGSMVEINKSRSPGQKASP